MRVKHGIYKVLKGESSYEFHWMGDLLSEAEFNERLRNQARSMAEDIDVLQMGMDLKDAINEGEKTVAQLEELEKISKLPLCDACRKLIGDFQ